MHEHDVIVSSKAIVMKIDRMWNSDPEKYNDVVVKLLDFYREYGDNFHHYKEEQVLFAEMVQHKEFQPQEIIVELEEQHDLFRNNIKEIMVELEEQEWQVVQNKLEQYIDLLLDHIGAENDEVFQMAQTLFNETELERIYFRFIDIDENLGAKRKIELERMLNQVFKK